MLFVNTDCLNKKDAEILKAQIEQQAKERRMLEADYEARLKADMVAMLTEIQLEIDSLEDTSNKDSLQPLFYQGIGACENLIQEKINTLRGEEE